LFFVTSYFSNKIEMRTCMWKSALEDISSTYKIWAWKLEKEGWGHKFTVKVWRGKNYLDTCGTAQFQWVRENNFTLTRFFCHKMPRRLVDMAEPRHFLQPLWKMKTVTVYLRGNWASNILVKSKKPISTKSPASDAGNVSWCNKSGECTKSCALVFRVFVQAGFILLGDALVKTVVFLRVVKYARNISSNR
jgi:hypothetical protein